MTLDFGHWPLASLCALLDKILALRVRYLFFNLVALSVGVSQKIAPLLEFCYNYTIQSLRRSGMHYYENVLGLIGRTPLVKLNRLNGGHQSHCAWRRWRI